MNRHISKHAAEGHFDGRNGFGTTLDIRAPLEAAERILIAEGIDPGESLLAIADGRGGTGNRGRSGRGGTGGGPAREERGEHQNEDQDGGPSGRLLLLLLRLWGIGR